MTVRQAIERVLAHSPLVAGSLYGLALAALVAVTWLSLADLYAGQQALASTADLLERLQGRKAAPPGGGSEMTGSPFLEGPTITVAGAALLQRVTSAVTRAGGTVQSSQVDALGSEGGMVKLQISCEIEQLAMQRLLYDLEAGMPFLFVDQLNVQVPQAVGAAATVGGGAATGKMRVQLAVSGQWQGGQK
jgi:general secretion pathway protein M